MDHQKHKEFFYSGDVEPDFCSFPQLPDDYLWENWILY
eukprot:gene9076-16200_t